MPVEPSHPLSSSQRRTLKAVVLELRRILEGDPARAGAGRSGDLAAVLAAIGVRADRPPTPATPATPATPTTPTAAHLALSQAAGLSWGDAVRALIREASYGWCNRLVALRCLEARELIDEVIVQRDAYGNRSLEHHRLASRAPERCTGDDDGLGAVLLDSFARQAERLPQLFDPDAPCLALRPSPAALGACVGLLSGSRATSSGETADEASFRAADALGWAYQYYNALEREELLLGLRSVAAAKVEGPKLIAVTQLYTEGYMVRFVVHNALGGLWTSMVPGSKLGSRLSELVTTVAWRGHEPKRVEGIRVLDPACGSGHFLLEAFDVLYAMYQEQGSPAQPEAICRSIFEHNLFGIDLDPRAIEIAEAMLWMKAQAHGAELGGVSLHLVASDLSLAGSGALLERWLKRHQDHSTAAQAVRELGRALEGARELGSLLRFEPQTLAACVELERLLDRSEPAQDEQERLLERALRRGIRLVRLLSQRYDVVLANPPYVDKRDYGPTLRNHLRLRFPQGAGNSFAAFVLRALELSSAVVGMVTPQSWLTLRSYAPLRRAVSGTARFVTLAELGAGAFQDAGVDPALFVLAHEPDAQVRGSARAVGFDVLRAKDKAQALAAAVEQARLGVPAAASEFCLDAVAGLPGAPFLFTLGPGSLRCFQEQPALRTRADVVLGMKTADNQRYVRQWWELCATPAELRAQGWAPYEKQANGQRYASGSAHLVRWTPASIGAFRRCHSAQLPNERYWFKAGIAYGLVSHNFTAKLMRAGHMADMAASCVFPHAPEDTHLLLGLLGSSLVQYWLRKLNPTVNYQPGDLQRLPLPAINPQARAIISSLVASAVQAIDSLRALEPTDRDFVPTPTACPTTCPTVRQLVRHGLIRRFEQELCYAQAQEAIERAVVRLYDLPKAELAQARAELGPMPGDQPICTDELDRRQASDRLAALLLSGELGRGPRARPRAPALAPATQDLRLGPRADTLLEQLALASAMHPSSVCELVREGIERLGWRLPKEERHIVSNAITVLALELVGHRWPAELGPGDAERLRRTGDGIVPLSSGTGSPSLLERLRAVLAERFGQGDWRRPEAEISEILGKPLGRWLETAFFPHHVAQLKRRPLLWQVCSGRPAARGAAAFSCLLYVHRLDQDTLPKLVAHYLRPLGERLQAELEASSPEPPRVRAALERQIGELRELDARLAEIAAEGFACSELDVDAAVDPLDRFAAAQAGDEPPGSRAELRASEGRYRPCVHDGIRVNIAPLERAQVLASKVLGADDAAHAISSRTRWRAEERDLCRQGKLEAPYWW